MAGNGPTMLCSSHHVRSMISRSNSTFLGTALVPLRTRPTSRQAATQAAGPRSTTACLVSAVIEFAGPTQRPQQPSQGSQHITIRRASNVFNGCSAGGARFQYGSTRIRTALNSVSFKHGTYFRAAVAPYLARPVAVHLRSNLHPGSASHLQQC